MSDTVYEDVRQQMAEDLWQQKIGKKKNCTGKELNISQIISVSVTTFRIIKQSEKNNKKFVCVLFLTDHFLWSFYSI
jgi:hypothetical protein